MNGHTIKNRKESVCVCIYMTVSVCRWSDQRGGGSEVGDFWRHSADPQPDRGGEPAHVGEDSQRLRQCCCVFLWVVAALEQGRWKRIYYKLLIYLILYFHDCPYLCTALVCSVLVSFPHCLYLHYWWTQLWCTMMVVVYFILCFFLAQENLKYLTVSLWRWPFHILLWCAVLIYSPDTGHHLLSAVSASESCLMWLFFAIYFQTTFCRRNTYMQNENISYIQHKVTSIH